MWQLNYVSSIFFFFGFDLIYWSIVLVLKCIPPKLSLLRFNLSWSWFLLCHIVVPYTYVYTYIFLCIHTHVYTCISIHTFDLLSKLQTLIFICYTYSHKCPTYPNSNSPNSTLKAVPPVFCVLSNFGSRTVSIITKLNPVILYLLLLPPSLISS